MKITLISPYQDVQAFGLRVLSSCLKKEGYDVQMIFLPKSFEGSYEENVLNEVVNLSKNSGLIGISLATNFFDKAVQITMKLKDNLNIPVLWGGIHPTIRPKECLNYADIVCIGEGEKTIVELATKIKNGKDYSNINGIAFKNKKKIVINKPRSLIEDLNTIPFPDYDYENHYVLNGSKIVKMDEILLKKHIGEVYETMLTRGCPFGCTYCCNNTFNKMYPNQRFIRKRGMDNMIKELINVKKSLSFIKHITLVDDAFFICTLKEIKDFCNKYKKKIRLPLRIDGASPLTLTKEKLAPLVGAGLISLKMGIQTGSEHTKELYKRCIPNQKVEKAVRIINEFKSKIKLPGYDIILDNPWETDEDLVQTLMFLVRLPVPYCLAIFSLTYFPETELYIKAKKEGIINDDIKDVYHKYYLTCKKTYLNRLFFLLNEYSSSGIKLSAKIMSLLTNKKLRKLKLNWVLYAILKMLSIPLTFNRSYKYLLYEGFKYIRRGDWYRIIRYLKDNIF